MTFDLASGEAPTLVVSAHLDDAVLSCWAAVSRPTTDVMTVFAGTPSKPIIAGHDLIAGFPNSTIAMRSRIAEDRAALDAFGNHTIRLDLLDAGYLRGPRNPQDTQALRNAITSWIADHAYAPKLLLFAPVGAGHCRSDRHDMEASSAPAGTTPVRWIKDAAYAIGGRWLARRILAYRKRRGRPILLPNHPDHLFVRDAVLAVALDHEHVDIVLYEDLPYLWSGNGDPQIADLERRFGITGDLAVLPIDQNSKFHRVSIYGSQVAHLDPTMRRLSSAATIPGSERFWALRRNGPQDRHSGLQASATPKGEDSRLGPRPPA